MIPMTIVIITLLAIIIRLLAIIITLLAIIIRLLAIIITLLAIIIRLLAIIITLLAIIIRLLAIIIRLLAIIIRLLAIIITLLAIIITICLGSCTGQWKASVRSGTCLNVYYDLKTWAQARAICQSFGADLLRIMDAPMNKFVVGKECSLFIGKVICKI